LKRTLIAIALLVCACRENETARELTGGDAERGRALMQQYGCGACHEVKGVRGANGLIGPPLSNIGSRTYLAGQLPNNPDNLIRWIREPQIVEAGTAMPNLNVTQQDARDIAAFLYTLR
jgi:cytochrome c1